MNDSKMSSLRSRNSIISYQTSTRSRRSHSTDSNITQPLSPNNTSEETSEISDPSSTETTCVLGETSRPRPQRRRNTEGTELSEINFRSAGLTKLDYFDGTTMSHALLNLKTRRANPSVNRLPNLKGTNISLPTTKTPEKPGVDNNSNSTQPSWVALTSIDLSKTRANLKPVAHINSHLNETGS